MMTDDDPRWDALDEAMAVPDLDAAEVLLHELEADYGDAHPDILYERAVIAWERGGPDAAVAPLDRLLAAAPDHADGHYLRGLVHAEHGEHADMVRHWVETARLDADASAGLEAEHGEDLDFIEATAAGVLAEIPERFQPYLRDVPVVLEPHPHLDIVSEGFDPRSLGLFEGLEQERIAVGEPAVAPTRIVLFWANLLADFPERDRLADEIEITLLHEVGHFFGLDEDDVERLGLE
jgi:predicted Zn-dependent protease with MMP-like domain